MDCPKVNHDLFGGYLHGPLDDSPYDVDGVLYCGRCHYTCGPSGQCNWNHSREILVVDCADGSSGSTAEGGVGAEHRESPSHESKTADESVTAPPSLSIGELLNTLEDAVYEAYSKAELAMHDLAGPVARREADTAKAEVQRLIVQLRRLVAGGK